MSLSVFASQYSARNYDPLPVMLTRGEGAYLWDTGGRRYIDMMSAYSAVSHGHAHPRIVAKLTAQAQRLAVPSRAYYNDQLEPFLKEICTLTGLDRALPMNTGAEAVETAIKAARRWGRRVKGVAEPEIVVAEGNFHGRTTTIVGFSSEPEYREDFGPFTRGFGVRASGILRPGRPRLHRQRPPCSSNRYRVKPASSFLPTAGFVACGGCAMSGGSCCCSTRCNRALVVRVRGSRSSMSIYSRTA